MHPGGVNTRLVACRFRDAEQEERLSLLCRSMTAA